MRTTVRLRADLHKEAKRAAALEGRTLTSLIEEGLVIVLGRSKGLPRKKARLPISRASGGTFEGVDLNRAASLADRMDDS